jgi:hypothetical protein
MYFFPFGIYKATLKCGWHKERLVKMLIYRVNTIELPAFYRILSKEQRCGLIIDKHQSRNKQSLILKISILLREHLWRAPAVAREVD